MVRSFGCSDRLDGKGDVFRGLGPLVGFNLAPFLSDLNDPAVKVVGVACDRIDSSVRSCEAKVDSVSGGSGFLPPRAWVENGVLQGTINPDPDGDVIGSSVLVFLSSSASSDFALVPGNC